MYKVIALSLALAATVGVSGVAGAQVARQVVKTQVKPVAKVKQPKVAKEESQAALQAEAKISVETARATALKEVPNGTIKSSELEREKGKLIYSVDIAVAGKSGIEEINVNAIDGKVVGPREHESLKAEKKEVAKEAKEIKVKK
jgi:uncharacterized membrane protein YkoI